MNRLRIFHVFLAHGVLCTTCNQVVKIKLKRGRWRYMSLGKHKNVQVVEYGGLVHTMHGQPGQSQRVKTSLIISRVGTSFLS